MRADELDDREIIGSVFVISGGYAPELYDPIEETFDESNRPIAAACRAVM